MYYTQSMAHTLSTSSRLCIRSRYARGPLPDYRHHGPAAGVAGSRRTAPGDSSASDHGRTASAGRIFWRAVLSGCAAAGFSPSRDCLPASASLYGSLNLGDFTQNNSFGGNRQNVLGRPFRGQKALSTIAENHKIAQVAQ